LSVGLIFLVLFAAALHASWNAIVKAGSETFLDTVLVAMGAALVGGLMLPLLALPAPASWPYLAASVAIHCGYFSLVALAYRTGDLSYAYPIMRGSAPLLTAWFAGVLVNEPLASGEWAGILLLSLGVLTLTGESWQSGQLRPAPTALGLANGIVIVAYTIVDGIGVRLSGHAASYVAWLFFLNAFPLLALALLKRPKALRGRIEAHWAKGVVGGACTIGSYGLALWVMTQSPIALVAALRESSVIFGTIIAAVFLKERFGAPRYVAASMVTAGAVAMKAL
jgi:drug/metabolite transporter (DMT)-like permease